MNNINWKDLEKGKDVFTIRNATMVDLRSKKIVQCYSANTKIRVIQKTIFNNHTYYRTETAKRNGLDWAFRASAFGLPDDKAPSAPKPEVLSLTSSTNSEKPVVRTLKPVVKQQKLTKKVASSEDGEKKRHHSWIKKIFRRKNV